MSKEETELVEVVTNLLETTPAQPENRELIEKVEVDDDEGKETPSVKPENRELIGKLEAAFKDDDFYEFTRLLKSKRRKSSKTFQRCLAFDTIIALLKLNDEKSQKYISLVFITCNLMHDEEFLVNEGKMLMHFVTENSCVGNLISCLMPDWFDPSSKHPRYYCLEMKFLQCKKEGKLLAKKLYDVIDDVSQYMYRDACLRIIYQYLLELSGSNTFENSDDTLITISKLLCLNEVLVMKNLEYKQLILEIIVVFWPPNCDSEIYKLIKEKIIDCLKKDSNQQTLFFDMAFSLKENLCVKFQNDFEKFIENGKKIFGDYFKVALKRPVRLLATIAEGKTDMLGAREFIYQKFPYIEVNSSIMASFNDVQDFKVFNFIPFKSKKLQFLSEILPRHENPEDLSEHFDEIKLIFKDYKNDHSMSSRDLKRFMFGRNIHCNMTAFEIILSTPGTSELINIIWEKFELSSREEILNEKFCSSNEPLEGKLLLSFVIDSNDDKNLTTFLMPIDDHPTFTKKATFMKLKSDQLFKITKITLFERHLIICLNDLARERQLSSLSFLNIFSLLEELNEFGIFESFASTIGILQDLSNNKKFYKELGDYMFFKELAMKSEKLRVKLKNRGIKMEDVKLGIKLLQSIYFVDDLLFTVVSYCKKDDVVYSTLKNNLVKTELGPSYEMLLNIVEGNEQDFIKCFRSKLESLETIYHERYLMRQSVDHFISNFLCNLLWAAVMHDRKLVIDHIIDYKNFATIKLSYPENVRNSETCHYVAIKLLESGHEIGTNELPSNWITSNDFEKFLNSRIRYQNTDLIELDCIFLLHAQTRKYQVNSKDDVDNKLILWEDTATLSYIMEKENLKSFLTHPVIETYINLKTHKYQNIYLCNLLMFIFIFILPFGSLFTRRFLFEEKSLSVNLALCFISILLLFLREVFQRFCVDKSWKKYMGKVSNWLEVLLIVFSLGTIMIFNVEQSHHSYAIIFFVATIFLSLAVLITTLPLSSVSLNMMMLRKASQTFFYFLITFIFILIAFSLSFCMIFGPKVEVKMASNTTDSNFTENSNDLKQEDDTFQNFSTFPNAFSKVLLMLSGEYSIEPFNLSDFYEMIFFLFFVVSTFVIFNLIQGLTFDDVQKLREDASRLILEHNAKKFIATSDYCFGLYTQYRLHYIETSDLNFVEECFVKLIKGLITRNPFVHKIGKVYINIKTKEITTEINRRQVLIVNKKINDVDFDKIVAVIDRNSQQRS